MKTTTRARLEAVLHQLEVGEASDGDISDIRWCADQLKAILADADDEE